MLDERDDIQETGKARPKKKLSFFQKLGIFWNCLWLAFYLFYCVYNIVSEQGNRVVNYILLGITVAYFLLFVIIWVVLGRKGKSYTGAGKRIYKIVRKLLLLVNTALAGGTIINMGLNGTFIITVFAVISIVNIALNILWLLIKPIIKRRVKETATTIKQEAKDAVDGVKSLVSSLSRRVLGRKGEQAQHEETAAAEEVAATVDTEDEEAEDRK